MSEYCHMKVLRVPLDKYISNFDYRTFNYDDFEDKYKDVMGYDPGYFEIMSTVDHHYYLDFILEKAYDSEGCWGKSRNLYKNECIKYYDTFRIIFPNIRMRDVHLIEYCWYNGVEPDNYYSHDEDPFWDEIPSPSELK